jgi:hypothetical protein
MLCLRAAGAAIADGEIRQAEILEEALARHREALGSQQVLAVIAVDVERVGGDAVALAQHQILEDAAIAEADPLDIPAADAAAAEGIDEAVVPRRGRREGVGAASLVGSCRIAVS